MEIWSSDFILLTLAFFVVAIIYSSVGHAGASGYIAAMTLLGVAPLLMRPTALMLNIIVSTIGFYRFYKAGFVNFKKVIPFVISSAPAAYFSAQLNVEKKYLFLVLGLILLLSAIKLIFSKVILIHGENIKNVNWPIAFITGGFIGFFSGISGTGGAIFFTPLLLQMNWAPPKQAAGLSVMFVLANSVFGLIGIMKSNVFFDFNLMLIWSVVVSTGALLGTYFGVFKFSNSRIKKMLGVILLIAAGKLFANAFSATNL